MNTIYSFLPGVIRLIASIIPILLLFFYTKTATLEEIGLVSYFISLITIIGVITDFGFPETLQRFLPIEKDSRKFLSSILVVEFIIVTIVLIFFSMLDQVTNGQLSKNYLDILLLIFFFSSSNVIVIAFNGLKDKLRVSLYFLGSAISFFLISYALFTFGITDAVYSFLLGRLISWMIFTILPLTDMVFRGQFIFSINISSRVFIFAFNSFFVSIAYILFTQWDSILVTQFGSLEENGIYKSIVFIASLPLALRVILETKLLPEFSSFIKNGNIARLNREYTVLTSLLASLGFICSLVSIIIAKPILLLFYNSEISLNSDFIFPITLLGTFLYITSVPGAIVLQAIGKENIIRNISILQSLLFFIISLLFFNKFGIRLLPVLLLLVNSFFFIFIFYKSKILLRKNNLLH